MKSNRSCLWKMNATSLPLAASGNRVLCNQHGNSSSDHDQHLGRSSAAPWSLYDPASEALLPSPWGLFEERVRSGPFRLTSFPSQPYSPYQILFLRGGPGQRASPTLRQFIRTNTPPRLRGEWFLHLPQEPEESNLSNEEFKKAMKKLKKQAYSPHPPRRAKRGGLFSNWSSISGSKVVKEEEDTENDERKECAICLEAFKLNEQVLVTPCNHMFHHDCLVPWVKSHGKCPVCRFKLFERRETAVAANNSSVMRSSNGDVELALELISLLRAMEEAFNWVNHR